MIRPFTLPDLSRVLQIERRSFPKSPYDWATFVNLYYQYPGTFLVYYDKVQERNEVIVLGYIIYSPDGHLISIAVDRDHRRQGIGKKLFDKALFASKARKLWAEVRRSNVVAQIFYLKLGFRVIGEVPNYYGNEDALIVFWVPPATPSTR